MTDQLTVPSDDDVTAVHVRLGSCEAETENRSRRQEDGFSCVPAFYATSSVCTIAAAKQS